MFKDREYTNEKRIENYLNTTISSGDAEQYIKAAQRFIEKYTARVFRSDTIATTRLFDGRGKQDLSIDDCTEITLLEVGNNSWGDTFSTISAGGANGYYTLPTNALAHDLPITKLLLRSRFFISGHANQRITAKWGYSAKVPEDITFAATVIASAMYYANRGENSGPVKSEKIGEYAVSYADNSKYDDKVQSLDILDSYKKILI